MSILKNLQKSFKSHHLIALLGVVILIAALSQYSGRKGSAHEGADDNQRPPEYLQTDQQQRLYDTTADASTQGVQPANPKGQNELFASAGGLTTATTGLPPSCTQHKTSDPKELLPRGGTHNEFTRLNPKGANDLSHVNLLSAGYHSGINTVGGSLRNANLQVRSEPPNPTKAVSPWMNSTIEPDLMRVPLELGCGSH